MNPLIEKAINAGINWINDWGNDSLQDVMRTGVKRLNDFVHSSENKIDDNILSKLPPKIAMLGQIMHEEINKK